MKDPESAPPSYGRNPVHKYRKYEKNDDPCVIFVYGSMGEAFGGPARGVVDMLSHHLHLSPKLDVDSRHTL